MQFRKSQVTNNKTTLITKLRTETKRNQPTIPKKLKFNIQKTLKQISNKASQTKPGEIKEEIGHCK